eukprot:1732457-Rhodomonas_salina.2
MKKKGSIGKVWFVARALDVGCGGEERGGAEKSEEERGPVAMASRKTPVLSARSTHTQQASRMLLRFTPAAVSVAMWDTVERCGSTMKQVGRYKFVSNSTYPERCRKPRGSAACGAAPASSRMFWFTTTDRSSHGPACPTKQSKLSAATTCMPPGQNQGPQCIVLGDWESYEGVSGQTGL